MVFHWSLSDNKSPQIYRNLLSILADLINAVYGMVSSRPVISKSSNLFTNFSLTIPRAPITIGIIVPFMFHSFFYFIAMPKYLSFFSLSFNFTLRLAGRAKSSILQVLHFLLIIIRSSRLAEIRWSVCMSQSHKSLCVSFFRTGTGLCIYHLFLWSNSNFLQISQCITLPTHSFFVLYSFCANLLHSLIMWLIVSSLSPSAVLLCLIYSLFIWLVLMALFWVAIRRQSVSLFRFSFLSHIRVFSFCLWDA